MEAGKTIRSFRKLHGIKQRELAARLYISQQSLSLMESGKSKVSVDMMDKILHIMGYKLVIVKIGDDKQ